MRLTIVSMQGAAVGGPCPVETMLYDSDGNGYAVIGVDVPYLGPAPLYIPSNEFLEALEIDEAGCLLFPEAIPADTAKSGQSAYPLEISALLPGEGRMRAGESKVFKISVQIADVFARGTPFIAIRPEEEVEARLRLLGPGFETSPPHDQALFAVLGFERSIEGQWVIAPKATSEGTQELILELLIGDRAYTREVVMDVRTSVGLRHSTLKVLTYIGATLVFFATLINYLLDIATKLRPQSRARTEVSDPHEGVKGTGEIETR
jgi:hypothetical protein